MTPEYNPKMIRNVSIIAHIDHGKTTLSDHILASGGMLPQKLMGTARALDDLEEEQKRGITIESSLASMDIPLDKELIYNLNLIDTPGHVDFSGKVAEALRLVDGSIVLVDAVEGIMAQTTTVLRQAMREFIKPILVINKIDRLILELELPLVDIQRKIQNIVVEVRNICKSQGLEEEFLPNFQDGSVLLISAIDGWGVDAKSVTNQGLTMEKIVDAYIHRNVDSLREQSPLLKIISRAMFYNLPDPIESQQYKFPRLLTENSEYSQEFIDYVHACKKGNPAIVLIGKLQQIGRATIYGSLVRVVSGSIKKNSELYSSRLNEKVRISRVVKIRGHRIVEEKELVAGEVGAAIITPAVVPGDILSYSQASDLHTRNIGYVQQPVVSISIEPMKIKDMSKVHNALEEMANSTPGLVYETDPETGELKALGVGTLQLDIVVTNLRKMGLDIETSSPMIVKYEMPLFSNTFELSKHPGYHVTCGPTPEVELPERYRTLYDDQHDNHFVIESGNSVSLEGTEGLEEVFRQAMRVSPMTSEHIRNLTIVLTEKFAMTVIKSYEMGIIVASSMIREALINSGAKVHEPYYDLEINVPESYVGPLIQELQRLSATVEDMISDGHINTIYSSISIAQSGKIADTFRAVTDGNAFWNFTAVKFIPEM